MAHQIICYFVDRTYLVEPADIILIKIWGFPRDFDHKITLNFEEKNYSSTIDFPDHVQRYFQEEAKFGAILGPFPGI